MCDYGENEVAKVHLWSTMGEKSQNDLLVMQNSMIMRKICIFLLLISLSGLAAGQGRYGWDRLDSLMIGEQYATAYPMAQGYYRQALDSGTGAEVLTAALYLTMADYAYSKDATDSALARYGLLVRRLEGVDRAVAYTFLFSTYNAIYAEYYHRIIRNRVSDDPGRKYPFWHRQRMEDTLMRCADSVLAYAGELRTTPLEPYRRLFRSDSTLLPPLDSTLLGMLVQTLLSIDYLHINQNENSQFPLPIHQRVAELYASYGTADMRLWLDLKRMDLFYPDSNTVRDIEGLMGHYADGPGEEMRALLGFYYAKYLSFDQQKMKAEAVCLSTEQAYPGTYGAHRCRLLRVYDICQSQFELIYSDVESSQRSRLACVRARNIGRLNFRLVPVGGFSTKNAAAFFDSLMTLTPVKEWQQALPDAGDHCWHEYLIALPPVPQGEYYLLAYSDSLFCYSDYRSADAIFICYDNYVGRRGTWLTISSGHLADRLSGQPLAGNSVTMSRKGGMSGRDFHRRRLTDKEGYFHFPASSPAYMFSHDIRLSATVDGYEYYYDESDYPLYTNRYYRHDWRTKFLKNVMTDRPVYRLGDTVRFTCVAYRLHLSGREMRQRLRPSRHLELIAIFGKSYGKEQDTLRLTTDGHGRCWGEFVIPPDGQNGDYCLVVKSDDDDGFWGNSYYAYRSIRVEAYKPPHFMVTLSRQPDSTQPAGTKASFGQPVTLYGSAVSYSGAPMEGATVKWEVSCERMTFPPAANTVADEFPYHDSLTVGADGLFQFTFTPERPEEGGTYIYSAYVRVTDADGELHEQHLSFHVSDADGYCLVTGDDLSHLTFAYVDFDGNPLEDTVQVELYQLRQPDTVRTLDPIMERYPEARWVGTKGEFRRLFPHRAFSREEGDRHAWPVVAKRFSAATTGRALTIPDLPSGLYRITFRTPDGHISDTLVNHVARGGRVTGDDVVWLRTTPQRDLSFGSYGGNVLYCRVGDTARIELGSPYGNQPLYYRISHAAKVYKQGMMVLDSSHSSTIIIPVTRKMEDGCVVQLSAVREGRVFSTSCAVVVLRPDLQLGISTETFRDRLQPGEKEQWTFRIDNRNPALPDGGRRLYGGNAHPHGGRRLYGGNAQGDVNMCATLYDRSLEQYGLLSYGFRPWLDREFGRRALIEKSSTLFIKPSVKFKLSLIPGLTRNLNRRSATASGANSPSLGFTLLDRASYHEMLLRRFNTGNFQGTVVDAKTQEPIPFASVVVFLNRRQVKGTNTDFDGHFVFRDLLPGQYDVVVSSVGYHKYGRVLSIDDNRAIVWNVPLQSSGVVLEEVQIIDKRTPVIEIGAPVHSVRISSDDIARMPSSSEDDIVAAVGGVGFSDGSSPRKLTGGVRKRTGVNVPKEAIAEISPMFNFDGFAADKPVALRKNLSTLAFFEPALSSDKEGRVTVSFTLPDALTQWRLLGFAWSDRFQLGSLDRLVRSQKELMVQPLMPRFLRQGDTVVIPAKVSNLTDSTLAVNVEFSFECPINSQFSILNWLHNQQSCCWLHKVADLSSQFSIPAHSSALATMRLAVPEGWHSATYKVCARGVHHSDGEQGVLPVLSNRERITTSHLLYVPGSPDGKEVTRTFSITLPPQAEGDSTLLVFTANPIDYAIQALPHFKKLRMPGNIYLANSIYVDHLTTLFDTLSPKERRHVEVRVKTNLGKLLNAQTSQGGWSWMPAGKTASRYVTESILQRLATCPSLDYERRQYLRAVGYLDKLLVEEYRDTQSLDDCLSLLYTRSLYHDIKPLAECDSLTQEAYRFYLGYLKMNDAHLRTLYAQGQAALLFLYMGDTAEAVRLATRIRESAHVSDETGMYWNSNTSGYGWYQRPIETAALMVKVFAEVQHDWQSVNRIQQWILASKRGTTWHTDLSTAAALAALLTQPENQNDPSTSSGRENEKQVTLLCNGQEIPLSVPTQELAPTQAINQFQLSTHNSSPAWGALFHSHDTPIDSIQYNGTGLSLRKTLSRVNADGSLTLIGKEALRAGDRIRVHIDIDCTRDFDNMVLSDQRASAFEPVTTASGWRWNDGLWYYVDVRDEQVDCYVDHLSEGHYYVEYDLWVRHLGTFSNGICTLHSVYAPEFRANTASLTITTQQ